jgi:hypothetical protein
LLGQGWAWLARLLNGVPPTRLAAAALHAFLDVGGWRLGAVYRRQFDKLLATLAAPGGWLARLEAAVASGGADAQAELTRLRDFLGQQRHREAPAMRTLPASDESSRLGAET